MKNSIELFRHNRSGKDFTSLKRLITFVCATVLIAPFAQASNPALLRIKNLSNEQQTFVVNAAQNCMDGIVAGAKIAVGPYSSVDHIFYKNDGSCSGDLGIFSMTPVIEGVENPDYTAFYINGEGGITTQGKVPNYPSWVDNEIYRDPSTNHSVNTWNVELPGKPLMLLGRPKGYWSESGCSGGQSCTLEISSSITAGTIKQEEWSKELTQSISATITAGLEVEAAGVTGSVETSYTSSTSGMIGSATTMINSNDLTTSQKCTVPTDMTNFDIYKIWQWTVSTPVGTNDVVAKTCDITCTPDGNAPKFLPGWPESIKACKWKTGETRTKFEPANLLRKTPPPAQRNPKDACVRFFSGENGGGRMSEQCTDLTNSKGYTNHVLPDQLINQVRSYKCGKSISKFYVLLKTGNGQTFNCESSDKNHKIPGTTMQSKSMISIFRSVNR